MTSKKVTVVSSFHVKDWEVYAKNFVESFIDKWESTIDLRLYYHNGELPEDAPDAPNVSYFSLDSDEDLTTFKNDNAEYNGKEPNGGYNYRMDVIKFCHKVFAITNSANIDGYLVWLDADTVSKDHMSWSDIVNFAAPNEEAEVVHLGRTAIDYSETSFLSFNLNSTRTLEFLSDFRGMYTSHEVFGYREWHDGFVFTRLLNIHEEHGLNVYNMSPDCTDLNAFATSKLGKFLEHKKGNLKYNKEEESNQIPAMPVGPQRYAYINSLVAFYERKNLLEVGTWNGDRAIQMASAAFAKSNVVHYTGFDLFDYATEETDKAELNTKAHHTKKQVEEKLTEFAKKVKEDGKTFTFCLYAGDSKETLKLIHDKDFRNTHNIHPDFAYIDGGHSIQTCSSDYEMLKHVPFVIIDDYFTADEEGKEVDPEMCGTNYVYDNLIDDVARKKILTSKDRVLGGGITNLVAVLHYDKLPDFPEMTLAPVQNRTPIKVTPHDSMPDEYIQESITANKNKMNRWIKKAGAPNNEHMCIVSGGPSLKKNIDKLKQIVAEKRSKVVCVKHSLPVLVKEGIIPWGCIVLDPRPIDGVSTHGVKRRDLFKDIPEKTKFFVASMTDVTAVDYILSKTDNVYGWDAFSQAIQNWPLLRDTMLIAGGTCAATRAIGLFHVLGFRNFDLFGFDACIEGEPEDKEELLESGSPKWIKVGIGEEEEKFWVTGELLAMAQDMENMLDNKSVDMTLNLHCGGLVNAIWKDRVSNGYIKPHYTEILNG